MPQPLPQQAAPTSAPAVGSTPSVHVHQIGPVQVTVAEHDGARPYLLLHGGGGPATMSAFAALLATRGHARVLLPTHPGFDGTARPESLSDVRSLAQLYTGLLDQLDLDDVTVIGSSLGGWVAAELALLGSPRVTRVVVVNGVGIEVEGHPMTDVSGLSPVELARISFHDPSRSPALANSAPANPGAASPANPGAASGPGPDIRALVAYAGRTMSDPGLRERLAKVAVPVLVVWGESDGIVDLEYGRAYAGAVPGARFLPIPESGHLPTVETPERLLAAL
jgi:pimeloyl-ACP methyl ester carboxylesterase